RRILMMIPTLFVVAVVIFVVLRVVPGDVAIVILGGDTGVVDPRQLQAVREQLGLNAPLPVQFVRWLWAALHLDFGNSFHTGKAVLADIVQKLPLTAEIALVASVIAAGLSIPLGTLAALKQEGWPDRAILLVTIVGLGAPSFWVGILLLIAVVTFTNWSPP